MQRGLAEGCIIQGYKNHVSSIMVSIMGGRPNVKTSDSASKNSLTIDNKELGREQVEDGDESITERERMDAVTEGASSSKA